MQKTLILGVLFACTTITCMDTPPIAKLTSDNFEQSLKHSDTGNSPENQNQLTPPHQGNFNSSFSLRRSETPTHSTHASPNHFQPNNAALENDDNDEGSTSNARPSTPVAKDEGLLHLYEEILNACLKRFNENLKKAKNWESEQRSEIENATVSDIIVNAMRNPDHTSVVSSQTNSAFSKIQNNYPFNSHQPFSANGQYPSKTRE